MSDKKHVLSEIFLSIEGEAKYTGHPTIYIRYAGCNMKCAGFNNPDNLIGEDGYAPVPFDIIATSSISEIPIINMGCDSQYAVNPKFKHMWLTLNTEDLITELENQLPHNVWYHPITDHPTILSLTGGEPTLRWKSIVELLSNSRMNKVSHILIETNCSVPLNDVFIKFLTDWSTSNNALVTWSNSPKLAVSGESREKAIRPDIALKQQAMIDHCYGDQYFKFVCDGSEECFNEVSEVMQMYYDAGIHKNVPVYIMPACCTESQQQQVMQIVADKCIQKGYIYCHRVHNTVYENAIGK